MKNVLLLQLLFLFIIKGLSASEPVKDSVIMSASYKQDVYYSLHNGIIKSIDNTDWDLALFVSKNEMEIAGIRINSPKGIELYAYPKADIKGWTELDTLGMKNWKSLQNSDSKWNFGAFNANTTVQFDYGWGKYNYGTHQVVGDSLFVIKINDTIYKKIWIVMNDAAKKTYYIRYANIDNTKDTTVSIDYKSYIDRNFIYFNISDNKIIDREPLTTKWDFMFTVAKEEMAPGMYYITPVVMSNNYRVLTAKKEHCDPLTLDYLSAAFTNNISEIGTSWRKANPQTHKFDIVDSLVFFVNDTINHSIYKLLFTKCGGSNTGKMNFTKEEINTSVRSYTKSDNSFIVYPNPVKDILTINQTLQNTQYQVPGTKYSILFYTVTGKQVYSETMTSAQNQWKVDCSFLNKGIYFLVIKSDSYVYTHKLIINK
ncbi:MAG: T9SS type A sorting domain-containing protein [Bacteroidales bacterium]|nr:T9SS type A sorting domain-containing protein [Bacteroidales bacterium]